MTAPTVQERIAAHNRALQAEWRYRQALCGWDERYHLPSDFEPRVSPQTRADRLEEVVRLAAFAFVAFVCLVLVAAFAGGGA